jgi:Cytochrome P460
MKTNRLNAFIGFACPLILTACTTTQTHNWSPQIEQSLRGYAQEMTCVTPEYRQAPVLCIAPGPSGARMSQAKAKTPHGKKLYHLYTSDPIAYESAANGESTAPIGLTLVKESHYANIATPSDNARSSIQGEPTYIPGAISELFIMTKVGINTTQNTDAGWIYSVANPQGEIQTSGLIQSCIACHEVAPHNRLFGLAPATTIYDPIYDPSSHDFIGRGRDGIDD